MHGTIKPFSACNGLKPVKVTGAAGLHFIFQKGILPPGYLALPFVSVHPAAKN